MIVLLDFGPNDQIQFDCETQLAPKLTLDVTDFPVESGATYADSMIRRPREWTFTGIVSDTPLQPGILPLTANGQPRTSAVWARLVQAMNGRQSCTYSDDRDTIPVAAITSVEDNRTKDTAGSLRLTVTIREMLIASVQTAKARRLPANGRRKPPQTQTPSRVQNPTEVRKVGDTVVATQNANGQFDQATNFTTTEQTIAPQNLQVDSPPVNPAAVKPQAAALPQTAPTETNWRYTLFGGNRWQ